ncbi:MAG: DNA methyltransferase [Proteobacteria bacterium]|nr:DNA methyltransferase [Pseudomonadota bacterium]
MPRTPGRIFADGPPDLAEILVAALRAPQIDEETADSLTHPFHTYPARLHPATARILVELVARNAAPSDMIVDPFCGSGTVLVEARAAGFRSLGVDLNPLACLVAHAKTWTVTQRRRMELRDTAARIGRQVLEAGKSARRANAEPSPLRKPRGFDPNARDRRLAAWFQPHTRRELELLATLVDEIHEDDAELGDVLLACVSAILYKVSSRSSDTDGTWIDRNVPRGNAARLFVQRAIGLADGLDDLSYQQGEQPKIHEYDARGLGDLVAPGGAVGIITSPPYAGTYDYAEHQRLRFDFLCLRHRAMDEGEIGSRRSFANNSREALVRWRTALAETVATIAKALVPNGFAALVVGDSVVSSHAVYALDDLRDALTDDLQLAAWASQERPMLGSIERTAFGERYKAEHIVLLHRRP